MKPENDVADIFALFLGSSLLASMRSTLKCLRLLLPGDEENAGGEGVWPFPAGIFIPDINFIKWQ